MMLGVMPAPDTDVSLREYIEKQLELRDRAIDIASQTMNRRLDAMNDLRRQIERERGGFVLMQTYEEKHIALQHRVDTLENWRANLTGRVVGFAVIGTLLVGTSSAFIGHLVP